VTVKNPRERPEVWTPLPRSQTPRGEAQVEVRRQASAAESCAI
jgi:hypothetical protein